MIKQTRCHVLEEYGLDGGHRDEVEKASGSILWNDMEPSQVHFKTEILILPLAQSFGELWQVLLSVLNGMEDPMISTPEMEKPAGMGNKNLGTRTDYFSKISTLRTSGESKQKIVENQFLLSANLDSTVLLVDERANLKIMGRMTIAIELLGTQLEEKETIKVWIIWLRWSCCLQACCIFAAGEAASKFGSFRRLVLDICLHILFAHLKLVTENSCTIVQGTEGNNFIWWWGSISVPVSRAAKAHPLLQKGKCSTW